MKSALKRWGREALIVLAKHIRAAVERMDKAMGAACVRLVPQRGSRCVFEGNGKLIDPHRLELGDDIFIGRNFFIRATGGVRIGSYTHISRNVTLHTANHNISGKALPYDDTLITKPIRIGKYVWIGMNCCILPGVSIGDGAVIGMGTVVSKDVAPGEIVVGAGQRVVGRRDVDRTERLRSNGNYLKIRNDWAS